MKLIERLKPEVLVELNTLEKDYPYTYKEIMYQLSTRDAWTRLDYIVAKDIELYCKVDFISDAFYTCDEVESNTSAIHKQTI